MKLLQINLHHSKPVSAALLLKLTSGEADIVLLQKPWINGDRICGLGTPTNYLFHASGKRKAGSCILIKKQLIAFFLSQFSDGDITALRLETDERSIVICYFYLAHNHPRPVPVIVISNLIRDYAIADILIGGDANAHHGIWGSSNVRGDLLYEVLDITLASSALIEQVSQGGLKSLVTKKKNVEQLLTMQKG